MLETQIAATLPPTEPARTRTYSWSDPQLTAVQIGKLSGVETLQAIGLGHLPAPPIMHTLGMQGLDAAEGRVTFTMQAREFHYNPLGTVHGGVLSTMLDSAAGCAVHSTLQAGWGYTSLDLNVKFLRAVTVDSGLLRCEGTVVNRGRTTALAEACLYDKADRLVAHATSTCLLFQIPA